MDAPLWSPSIGLLDDLNRVLSSSLLDIAGAFSEMLSPWVRHSALVIFTEDCTGRPQKKAGDRAIIDQVTIAELDTLRASMTPWATPLWDQHARVGAVDRPVAAWMASTGAMLVLTDPAVVQSDTAPQSAGVDPATTASTVGRLWELVASSIRQQVAAASPAYLLDSRAASTERARVIADLTDAHSTTLESLLAILRSRDATDATARQTATDVAATAMVQLRAVSDRDRSLSEEPVARAFERLRDDLRPLVRFGDLDVQFVEPPVTGRALPGEVAHAGRAIVRGAVLALVEQTGVARVRVQWDCDGANLLIHIRDDGPGDLTLETPSVRQLAMRVAALNGTLHVDAIPGWGSDMTVVLPLDVPTTSLPPAAEWSLSPRERQVFELVASGVRNRAIAEKLTISENTVKFHVANLFRKVGASTRAELAALAR